jgi:hypothetical protein
MVGDSLEQRPFATLLERKKRSKEKREKRIEVAELNLKRTSQEK